MRAVFARVAVSVGRKKVVVRARVMVVVATAAVVKGAERRAVV